MSNIIFAKKTPLIVRNLSLRAKGGVPEHSVYTRRRRLYVYMYFDVSYACVYELNNIHGGFVEAGSPDSASFVRSAACTCLNEGTEVDSSGNSDAV